MSVRSPLGLAALGATLLGSGLFGASACATAAQPADPVPARLQNPSDTATREAIRVFVREQAGRGYIARPDSLAASSQLVIVERQRGEAELGTRSDRTQALRPAPRFRLVTAVDGSCWLMREGGETDRVALRLPASAQCEAESG